MPSSVKLPNCLPPSIAPSPFSQSIPVISSLSVPLTTAINRPAASPSTLLPGMFIPMDEKIESIVSSAIRVNLIEESSDSNTTSYLTLACKRSRSDGHNASWTKFKGVVPQHNGHWGAQIYANHQRVWLGTFKSDKEAAMAYDSAATKLRSGDSHRNFPWTKHTVQEPIFQSHFCTEAILNMIKDGSYPSKFDEFLRNQRFEKEIGLNLVHANGGFSCRLLFEKELTPSDVGQLNRLVIPKKYAVKYFPEIVEGTEENENCGNVDDVQLGFHDREMRLWKFRYCYWTSSQSYVFTRGWNRFVKEKDLKANDTVAFYLNKSRGGSKGWIIDVGYKGGASNCGAVEVHLCLGSGQNGNFGMAKEEREKMENQKLVVGSGPAANVVKKGFKVFGFQINT
ncbi:unnamed protein product [Ilex paraguariensis]|uniref:Uncharacterized protein n=1 Tax=Ilex paraguariensis TaxID=185542 RepID=A0ABC8RIB3_9AQUA